MGEQSIFYINWHRGLWLGFGIDKWGGNNCLALYFACFIIQIEFKKKTDQNKWLNFFGKDLL